MLSGTDSHLAGLGNMAEFTAPNQKGKPGYEGYLNARVVPVSSLLKDAGYNRSRMRSASVSYLKPRSKSYGTRWARRQWRGAQRLLTTKFSSRLPTLQLYGRGA